MPASGTGVPAGHFGVTRAQWAAKLLAELACPITVNNIKAIVAWESAEGTAAAANPLATTQPMPHATNFNGVGVKNYVSTSQGLAATVKTIRNGRYGAILSSLTRSADPRSTGALVDASSWGSHGVSGIAASYSNAGTFHAASIMPVPPGSHDTRSITTAAGDVAGAAEHAASSIVGGVEGYIRRGALFLIGGALVVAGGILLVSKSDIGKAAISAASEGAA